MLCLFALSALFCLLISHRIRHIKQSLVKLALFNYISYLLGNCADERDILQETHLDLWRKAGTYDVERPFLPWARAIARYQVLTFRKRQNRVRLLFDEELLKTARPRPRGGYSRTCSASSVRAGPGARSRDTPTNRSFSWTLGLMKKGVVVTYDVPKQTDGLIPEIFLRQLRKIGAAVKGGF